MRMSEPAAILEDTIDEGLQERSTAGDNSRPETINRKLLSALSFQELEANAVEITRTKNVIIRTPWNKTDADILQSDDLNARIGRLRQDGYFVWTQHHDAGLSIHVSWS